MISGLLLVPFAPLSLSSLPSLSLVFNFLFYRKRRVSDSTPPDVSSSFLDVACGKPPRWPSRSLAPLQNNTKRRPSPFVLDPEPFLEHRPSRFSSPSHQTEYFAYRLSTAENKHWIPTINYPAYRHLTSENRYRGLPGCVLERCYREV